MTNMGLILEISAAGQNFVDHKDFGACQQLIDEAREVADHAKELPSILIGKLTNIVKLIPKNFLKVINYTLIMDDIDSKDFMKMGEDIASTIFDLSH